MSDPVEINWDVCRKAECRAFYEGRGLPSCSWEHDKPIVAMPEYGIKAMMPPDCPYREKMAMAF